MIVPRLSSLKEIVSDRSECSYGKPPVQKTHVDMAEKIG